MLKKGSKAFAPKFKPKTARRPTPASAPSSARPSVEPLSTTPATDVPSADVSQPNVENDVSRQSVEQINSSNVDATPQTESTIVSHQTNNSTSQASDVISSPTGSKRKTRDEEAPEPPAKRTAAQPPSTETHESSVSTNIEMNEPSATTNTESQLPTPSNAHTPHIDPQSAVAGESNTSTTPQVQPPIPASTVSATYSQVDASESVVPVETAITVPSRSVSPASNHEQPNFRYPTPDGAEPMSGVIQSTEAADGELPGLGPAGDVNAGANNGQGAQVPQIVPMASLNPDGSAAAAVEELASAVQKGKQKKVTRRKRVQAAEAGDDARATVDMQINRPRRAPGAKRGRKRKDAPVGENGENEENGANGEKKKRKRRGATPDDAEDLTVNTEKTSMRVLCGNVKSGKKFSKHDLIKQRLQEDKIKRREERLKLMMEKTNPADDYNSDEEAALPRTSAARPSRIREASEPVQNTAAMQMRIVDGEIVLDNNTAQVDRHAQGRAAVGELEEVEEDDFSKLINYGTLVKREATQQWDFAATELFYDGLRQFGTDFEMISKMLRPRTRRQVKLKFNKEERNNPSKVNRALTGQKAPIDLAEYQKVTGKKLLEKKEIEEQQAKIRAQHDAADAAQEAEKAAEQRAKVAGINANRTGAPPSSQAEKEKQQAGTGTGTGAQQSAAARVLASFSDEENEPREAPKARRKTAKDKAKKNMNSANYTGEEFEVLGEVAPVPTRQYVREGIF